MAPKDVILAAELIRLIKSRHIDKSRHYLPDDPWRHISLFSGVGVNEGKNVLSSAKLSKRHRNRVFYVAL